MGNVQPNAEFNGKETEFSQTVKRFFEHLPKLPPKIFRNPGLYDELDEVWESIQPKLFEGVRVCLTQKVTDNIDVQNTIHIDPRKPNDFNISSKVSSSADFPLIWCELDQRGMLKTKFYHSPTKTLNVKAMTRLFTNYLEIPKLSVDYKANDYSATVMLRFIRNPFHSNSSVAAQLLHAVSKECALGFEYIYNFGMYESTNVSLVARYNFPNAVVTGKIQKNSMQVRLWKSVSPLLQCGVNVNSEFMQCNVFGALSYQFAFPSYKSFLRGSIDSHLAAFVVLEKTLDDFPFTFSCAFGYNHTYNNFKTGIGFEAAY